MNAVIDIGSNSVRLAIFADGQIVYKGKVTSQLGKGLAFTGRIDPVQKDKTVAAIQTLIVKAVIFGVERDKIKAFATATVRRAENAADFIEEVYKLSGIKIDVVSEDEEAELALKGCLKDEDGAVLDIGGGSAELIVRVGGAITYRHSLPLGAVVLTDMFGKNRDKMEEYLLKRVKEYGQVPSIKKLMGVGGTSSCCARVMARAREYDAELTDGKTVSLTDLEIIVDRFFKLKDEEIEKMGVEAPRTGIIAAGTLLLIAILKYLGLDEYTSSEGDNLEGYYLLKCGDDHEK